jgi:hypothetical protein
MAFESPFPSIQIKNITSIEIERIIGSLKSSQTQGYDIIYSKPVKPLSEFL